MSETNNLTVIFDRFLNQCEEMHVQSKDEDSAIDSLLPLIRNLKSYATKNNATALKKTWDTIDDYILRTFFANDQFVPVYQNTQRDLRLAGFLDSKNRVK